MFRFLRAGFPAAYRTVFARLRGTAARRLAACQRTVSRAAAHALPNCCALCGALSPTLLCSGCSVYWRDYRRRCVSCALPLPDNPHLMNANHPLRCGACITAPPAFDATVTLHDYAAPLDTLALQLKFHGKLAIAREFGARLAAQFGPHFTVPELVIPVPLARERLAARGYNQAWQIAKPFARALDIRATAHAVARIHNTPPQLRLDAAARQRNLRRAFALRCPPDTLRGRHIAIVDDVMTSGATLHALARTLKRAGAARVTNVVALRIPKE